MKMYNMEKNMNNKRLMAAKTVMAAAVVSIVSGCATSGMKVIEKDNASQQSLTNEFVEKAFIKTQPKGMISKADTFWVDKTPLPPRVDPASQLPPVFARHIDINEQASLPLSEVFVRLSKHPALNGMRFTVSPDVYEADPSRLGVNVGGAASSANSNADSTSARPSSNAAGAQGGGASATAGNRRVEVMVSDLILRGGTFAEVLDVVATKTNLAWRFDGEKVHFFRYESRIFKIDALAGSLSTSSTVGTTGSGSTASSGGGSSGGNSSIGSSSSSSTSVKTNSDLWSDISGAIQSQLSARGKMSLMPSTGQVTITDTPDQLRRIERYVKDLNSALGKQVAFNVHVYSVESNVGDGYGVDWSAVWSTVASKYKLGLTNSGNTQGLGNLFSVNLINAANGAPSNWNGTSAILGALSSVGKTTLVTSTSVVTLNNIPVPVSVTTETGYLESVSTTVTGSSGTSQTSLKPGSVTSGFNMSLLPRVGDGDDLMLQFGMDLSDLVKLTTFTSPDNKTSIQLPQKNLRNFLQRVSMRSGETLILSGFQQTLAQDTQNGIGSPKFWELGGSRNTSGKTTTLVILITPYVMAK
jgi:type IVB pilus formation R64 PilN family outer membrane protein